MSAHEEHHGPGHIISFKYTLGTFLALMVLTVVTVGVAQFDLGAMDMPVARCWWRGVKATLVCLFFMHLRWDRPINTLVLDWIFFVVLFLIITMFDTSQSVELKDDGGSPDVVTTLESQSLPVVD